MSIYRPAAKPHSHVHGESCNHGYHNHPKFAAPETQNIDTPIPPDAKKLKLTLTAMDCPTEAASLGRARNAISGQQVHAPESAFVLQTDGSWQEIPSDDIQVAQTVRARAGDRIALDGVVVQGGFIVNQASITGESMPDCCRKTSCI